MQIESIIKRPNGSKITIGDTQYHFKPNADGAHVADVENDAHIARFLSITEGFKLYRPDQVVEQEVEQYGGTNERHDLAEQYEAKFGKKPHHKMTVQKIKEALAEE
jgi:hypothetical protein